MQVPIKKQMITMKNCNFWDVMPYSLVEAYWHLVGIYSLRIHGQKVSTASTTLHIRFQTGVKDVKVCDDHTLIQILCFWTLSRRPVYICKHNVSETGFCLRLQAKRRVFKYKQDGVLHKNRALDDVQKHIFVKRCFFSPPPTKTATA
jgi:hypothetical protein